ncbi:MAG: Gmad2 immunoglobulin-like domain-containing protein [Nocardioides sp.]|nr:Gmad2 immunoglobulin-like domain-containing protein [Nocardioides sp.]
MSPTPLHVPFRAPLRAVALAAALLLTLGACGDDVVGETSAPTSGTPSAEPEPSASPTDEPKSTPSAAPTASASSDPSGRITITAPAPGAEVAAPFEVRGEANVYEATVSWELRDGEGIVADGFTTADEAYTMAPYRFTVEGVPSGDYTLVLFEADASDGEGTTARTEQPVTVTP